MSTDWKDEQGNTWSGSMTTSDIKRLRASGTDLMARKTFGRIFATLVQQVEFLSEFYRPQWESRGMTYLQFAPVLVDSLDAASDAFIHGFEEYLTREGREGYARTVREAMKLTAKG